MDPIEQRMHLITSALSIARELWRYGEPDLAERALALDVDAVLRVGRRTIALIRSGRAAAVWPGVPGNGAFVVAAIEELEGEPRAPTRKRRLPERKLPPHLQATEEERWQAASVVAEALDARFASAGQQHDD